MGVSEVIINEQALADTASAIKRYIEAYRDLVSTAVRNVRSCGGDWNDEDYDNLVSAVSSFQTDVDSMENAANQLIKRIDSKISQIRQLHSMKI